jgi:hypothetical protein
MAFIQDTAMEVDPAEGFMIVPVGSIGHGDNIRSIRDCFVLFPEP